MRRQSWLQITLISILILVVIIMLAQPSVAFAAASDALSLWWQVVIPSLLPFFIISELLIALGIAGSLGRAFEPLMRPLFRLPGAASIGVALGFFSGFPTGAAIAASLRSKGEISREEGERMIAFTNNASLLYLRVSVATGILGMPGAGGLLIAVHYLGNLFIGLLLRFCGKRHPDKGSRYRPPASAEAVIPGRLLREAAWKAASNIIIIGCFMLFFAVLARLLAASGLFQNISSRHGDLYAAIACGFWEMSLGVDATAAAFANPGAALPIIAALIGWGGISVQAQVAAMVAGTDIRIRLYLLSRLFHAALSYIMMRLLIAAGALSAMTATSSSGELAVNSSLRVCLLLLAVWFASACLLSLRQRLRRH